MKHTHPFNGPFSGTTQVSQYQKGKTNLDFTEARDSEWQWHQQICKSASRSRQITTPVPHHKKKGDKKLQSRKNTAKKDSQSQRKVYKNVRSKKPSKGWSQISEK